LIAYYQIYNEIDLQAIYDSSAKICIMELHLTTTMDSLEFLSLQPSNTDLFADIKSYEIVGESMQQHFEYKLQCSTTLSFFPQTEWEIKRRYSDFSFLAKVLERYNGSLIPPLPPKQLYPTISSDIAVQRTQELGLFVRNIARHPLLYLSYEFIIFLNASSKGFKTFRAVIDWLPDIELSQLQGKEAHASVTAPDSQQQAYGNSSSQSQGGFGTSVSTTLESAGSFVFGYASSLWSMSSQLLDKQINPSPFVAPPLDPEFVKRFEHRTKVCNALVKASSSMQTILELGKKRCDELSGISFYLSKVHSISCRIIYYYIMFY
jgi:hypothetical protein